MDARHQNSSTCSPRHAVAGIEDVVGVPGDEVVVDIVVVRHQHDGVAATEELGGQWHPSRDLVELVRADVRVVDHHLGTELDESTHDRGSRRLTSVVGVLLVGDAEHQDASAFDGLAPIVQPELDAPHDVGRHALVDVVGGDDEPGGHPELALDAPRQVRRVDREAMSADARTGAERREAERLRRGGVDRLPDVDAKRVGMDGQLVDEGDVHVAERVLEQLGQLRHPRRADGNGPLDEPPVERFDCGKARRRQAGDDLRDANQRPLAVPRIDALWRVTDVEVDAGLQAGCRFERWREQLVGRARVSGRLQHDQAPGPNAWADLFGRVPDRRQIGHPVGERRRDRDDGDIELAEVDGVGGRVIATRGHGSFDLDVGDIAHVRPAAAQLLHLACVDVVGRGDVADLNGSQRKRQPHVALADDEHSEGDCGGFGDRRGHRVTLFGDGCPAWHSAAHAPSCRGSANLGRSLRPRAGTYPSSRRA